MTKLETKWADLISKLEGVACEVLLIGDSQMEVKSDDKKLNLAMVMLFGLNNISETKDGVLVNLSGAVKL